MTAPGSAVAPPTAAAPQIPKVRRLTLGLTLYRLAVAIAGVFSRTILERRAARGKEDAARLPERLGHASTPRPDGPLIWLHAVSVGEAMMILPLLNALREERPDAAFLVTTGTVTSAQIMARQLPRDVIHQYVPIDHAKAVQNFLQHWRPGLGIFAESELWPNLILHAEAMDCKLALINARMMGKSLKNWKKWPASAKRLFSAFSWIGTADITTHDGLKPLIPNTHNTNTHNTKIQGQLVHVGNLKHASPAPEPNHAVLTSVRDHAGERALIWLAASTHEGEDESVLAAHAQVREDKPNALLILAPRHPERGPQIAALARQMGFTTALRSAGDGMHDDVSVYVVDTLGEMGSWYTLADMVFVAGSWKTGVGGHTPLEPAHARRPIIAGPNVANFADLYAQLNKNGGARTVTDADALAGALLALSSEERAAMVAAALAVAADGAQVLEDTMAGLRPLLPEISPEVNPEVNPHVKPEVTHA